MHSDETNAVLVARSFVRPDIIRDLAAEQLRQLSAKPHELENTTRLRLWVAQLDAEISERGLNNAQTTNTGGPRFGGGPKAEQADTNAARGG